VVGPNGNCPFAPGFSSCDLARFPRADIEVRRGRPFFADLGDPRISIRNKSRDAFEGLRHYGPEEIVDALAAILNQITGKNFGFIYNGATDPGRDKTVRGWRDFLQHNTCGDVV
jgi:hypothetical protein